MTERTIFAYFRTPDEAKKALGQLQSLELIDYTVERIDGFAGTGVQSLDTLGATITGKFPGLGYLTLNGDFDGPDAGILASSSVSASGYSSGGPENRVSGYDVMLVAIVNEGSYEQAEQIVRDAGAL